jgi:hypothetical protein
MLSFRPGDLWRHPMSVCTSDADAIACCAFCRKPLPAVNGQVQPWRAADGAFFCNEFCADDAEEARFQRRGKPHRMAGEHPRHV